MYTVYLFMSVVPWEEPKWFEYTTYRNYYQAEYDLHTFCRKEYCDLIEVPQAIGFIYKH